MPNASTMPNAADAAPLRLALIDNYDSYSYNLAHLLAAANRGVPPTMILSDAYTSLSALPGHFDGFVLSPGPGHPAKLTDLSPLQHDILQSSHPVLGVCLGHQALCHRTGGASISRLVTGPAHGVITDVRLSQAAATCPLFRSLPHSFRVVRYHSLAADIDSLDSAIVPTAWATDVHPVLGTSHRVLMAVRHTNRPHFGVQFHPESICSHHGDKLAANFISFAARMRSARNPSARVSNLAHVTEGTKRSTSYAFTPLVRQLDTVSVQPFALFEALYGKHDTAFWLDSGVKDPTLVSVFSNASPTQHTPSSDRTRHRHNARFSIMGACDGPFSELVTYDVSSNTLSVRTATGDTVTHKQSVFDYLGEQMTRRRAPRVSELPCDMVGGYVGYLGYELKQRSAAVQAPNRHVSALPDAWLVFADRTIIVDHSSGKLFVIALVAANQTEEEKAVVHSNNNSDAAQKWFDHVEEQLTYLATRPGQHHADEVRARWAARHIVQKPLTFEPERSQAQYLADIEQCLRAIDDGESYEVCLTNRLRIQVPSPTSPGDRVTDLDLDALELYAVLRTLNPAPYSAFLRLSRRDAVCCTSPERYLTVRSTTGSSGSGSGSDEEWERHVESKPIKGTRRRGHTNEEDNRLRDELAASPKDRRENLMIVDLVRNDLARCCAVGSVRVPHLMVVESYAAVHQLVSTVRGTLRTRVGAVDAVRAAYPMGSMTGAPKIRTMQLIDALETSARGVYSGSIGYMSATGAVDLNVVIRTAVVRDSHIEIGAGGAIVAGSSPHEEYEETMLKGRALMQSVALYLTGDRDAFVVQH